MGCPALVPWLRQIGVWIAAVAAFLGPWGVFVIAFADSALIPMPQGVDALLLAQAIASPEIAYLAAGLGVLGSTMGSTVLYFIGRRAGQAFLAKRISETGVGRLSGLMGQWGAAVLIPVVLIPLPLPMKPVVLSAGVFQMPLASFCLAVAVARFVRYYGIVFFARRYGESALELLTANWYVALIACALFVALFVGVHRLSSRWLRAAGKISA